MSRGRNGGSGAATVALRGPSCGAWWEGPIVGPPTLCTATGRLSRVGLICPRNQGRHRRRIYRQY